MLRELLCISTLHMHLHLKPTPAAGSLKDFPQASSLKNQALTKAGACRSALLPESLTGRPRAILRSVVGYVRHR